MGGMGMARRAVSVGVVVLSLIGLSSAQVCSGNVLDADRLVELNKCTTWQGDLVISGLLSEDLAPSNTSPGKSSLALSLTGVSGSLWVQDMAFPLEFSASLLETVNGQLHFFNMSDLVMPQFPTLDSANDIKFEKVTFAQPAVFNSTSFGSPKLVSSINFTSTNVAEINAAFDNGLAPISSQPSVASFTALDNPRLTRISVPGYVGADPMAIDIRGNSAQPTVEFPDIQSCSLNLQGIKNFSAPLLQTIKTRPARGATVSSTVPSTVPSSDGKPPLRVSKREASSEVTSNLITGNTISQLELRELLTIEGTLEISENDELESIAFPKLATINGQLEIDADIDSLDITSLQDAGLANGQFSIVSPSYPCENIDLTAGDNFSCQQHQRSTVGGSSQPGDGDQEPNEDPDDDDDEGDDSNGGGGLSTGAKAGIGVGVALGVLLIFAAAFLLFRRRSRRNTKPNRTTRSMGPDAYTKEHHTSSEAATSPARYSKVPSEMRTEEVNRPVSSLMDNQQHGAYHDAREGRGRSLSAHDRMDVVELEEQQGERFEMEEQQGMRHEMDARSLPDIDLDDESPERRSLEDIERSRNSGPVVGGAGSLPQHGPVSPVG